MSVFDHDPDADCRFGMAWEEHCSGCEGAERALADKLANLLLYMRSLTNDASGWAPQIDNALTAWRESRKA